MHPYPFALRLRRFLPAAVLALLSSGQVFAAVAPPPLPPGSHLVRVEGGMDRAERKRQERAHHHKLHHKKDLTRDDSVYGDPADDSPAKDKDKDKDKNPKPPKGGR